MTSGDEMTATSRRTDAIERASAARSAVPAVRRRTASAPVPRWSRRRGVVGVFAAFAVVGFAAAYVGPTSMALSEATAAEPVPVSLYASTIGDVQSYVTDGGSGESSMPALERGNYEVYVTPTPTPTPSPVEEASSSESDSDSGSGWMPPFVSPDPGSAQAIAYEMVLARGWGESEFSCLVALWNRESGWRVNAYNASSGAYGIPQSLPGNKMASAGADWETNPATQISWGLGYIGGRYGSPCGAWGHSESYGWY